MQAHRRLRSLGLLAFVLLAVGFVGLTVLFDRTLRGVRLDLTENRLYTLSPGTRALLDSLDEPVNLYFFFSREAAGPAPFLRTYANRVHELLEEMAARSNGRLRLYAIDPQPFSEEEDRAAEFGLRAVPLGVGSDAIYFGLAGTNATDGRAVIDFFQPAREPLLEYEVARLVQQLAEPRVRVVGLVTSLPLAGGFDPATRQMQQPWAIAEQIGESFELRTIPLDAAALPADLDALVVVHPKGLAPGLVYSIDQFLMRGGHLLLAVDPEAQQDPGAEQRAALFVGGDRSSTFEPLLGAWGVQFDPRRAFGDLEHALLVADPASGAPVRHLGFTAFGAANFAADDPLVAALETINFATPGFLAARPVDGVSFEPLVTSSARAAPIPVEKIAMTTSADGLRAGFEPTGERYVVAARIGGRLPSAFPGGPPEGVAAGAPHLARGERPASVVLVADTDFLSDLLWTRSRTVFGERYLEAWANNGDFVLNALDNLTGSAELVAIRGRASFARPFTRVEALRLRADERLRGTAIELQRELAETERRLAALEEQRGADAAQLATAEQQAEIARFQQEKLRIRQQLRAVQRGLDEEIERLGTRLRLLNIVAVPLLLTLVAGVVALLRRRRSAQSRVVG